MTRDRTTTSTPRRLSPLRDFLRTEAAGGVLLVIGAVAALVWANSPWSASYEELWTTSTSLTVGNHSLALDLRHVVNDVAMTVFFFVVGLEITRELATGHLSNRRSALLPAAAAVGGMVMPALLYLAIAGPSAAEGWAVPVATDIALAVGVLAVAGSSFPSSLRAFLLGLAIVDDIGAIVIIAVFYSDGIEWEWLAVGVAAVAFTVAARQFGITPLPVYLTLGTVLWFALHEAGIHATLAGVAMGLLAPTTPRRTPEMVDVEELTDLSTVEAARASREIVRSSVSVVEWLQHELHPWTSYAIVPLFALANAGIPISIDGLRDAAGTALTWGIIVGLVVGKPLGIFLATKLAVGSGIAEAPAGADRRRSLGVGTAAGIGFTVALFITQLAFDDPGQRADAKLAVLVASIIAAALAAALLRSSSKE